MHIRAILQHDLVDIATEQRVHAQLKALSDTDALRQELEASLVGFVLDVAWRSAVLGMGPADRTRHPDDLGFHVLLDGAGAADDEGLQEVSEPAKDDVVLRNLVMLVPGEPRVDADRESLVLEGRECEVHKGGSRGDVPCPGERDDLVVDGASDDGEAVVGGDEETEDVFGVELTADEVARVGDAALDLRWVRA